MTTTSTSPRSSNSCTLGPAHVTWTGTAEGDLRASVPAAWAWVRQVHGIDVHIVDRPAGVQGVDGDALVASRAGIELAIFSADCPPVAFASDEGVIGIAHAGWRGLTHGVIGATVDSMRRLGATRVRAALGPCIRPCCYEFGAGDLASAMARLDATVAAVTKAGSPALDMPQGVRVALDRCGVELTVDHGACTACDPGWFSHRARGDQGRQATTIVVPG